MSKGWLSLSMTCADKAATIEGENQPTVVLGDTFDFIKASCRDA